MITFKQKILAGEIKRADAMKVRYEDLHIEPGFNLRDDIESLTGEAREQAEADEESLFKHIMAGGQYPALEVRPREDGGVWLVDGHRRRRNIGRAIEAGAPMADKDGVVWVRVEAFSGNDADRTMRVLSSASSRQLSPLETARGYKTLAAFGWTPEHIAEARNKTRTHVDGLLILANANSDVQQMVRAGTVSAAVAVEAVRKHGEAAGAILAGEFDKARAQGKRKVTAGTIKGKALPRVIVDSVVDAVDALVGELPVELRASLAQKDSRLPDLILVPTWAVRDILDQHQVITEAKAADAQRVRDAQAKAAQMEIPANDNAAGIEGAA